MPYEFPTAFLRTRHLGLTPASSVIRSVGGGSQLQTAVAPSSELRIHFQFGDGRSGEYSLTRIILELERSSPRLAACLHFQALTRPSDTQSGSQTASRLRRLGQMDASLSGRRNFQCIRTLDIRVMGGPAEQTALAKAVCLMCKGKLSCWS